MKLYTSNMREIFNFPFNIENIKEELNFQHNIQKANCELMVKDNKNVICYINKRGIL